MRTISIESLSRRGTLVACALALAIVFVQSSCKQAASRTGAAFELSQGAEAADLSVNAHFVRDADDVPGFFRLSLPDSGVVPVSVTVHNKGSRPLVIHSPNGMSLDPGFDGFVLTAGGKRYLPVHPREAVARLLGATKARRFKPMGVFEVFVGRFVPPLGGYYIYNEAAIGRFYRPLFGRSLYPALPSGMFQPVVIGPGETKTGYLYFHVERDMVADSVAGVDFRKRPKRVAIPFPGVACELLVRGCLPWAAEGTLDGYDFRFADGWLFALRTGPPAEGGLVAAPVTSNARQPFGRFSSIGSVSSSSGRIADASVRGDVAAVGLNFKSKSKLFQGMLAPSPRPLGNKSLPRLAKRVFVGPDGLLVLTNDGFCTMLSRDALDQWAHGRLGSDIDDAFLLGDSLLVFEHGNGLVLFRARRDNALARIGGVALVKGRREAVGCLGDKLVVLDKGRESEGDTVSLFMRSGLSEIRRMSLPGHVALAAAGDSGLLILLEDGTLLKLAPAPLASMRIDEAGYLPFVARTLAVAGFGFAAVGADGAWAAGLVSDYSPGGHGMTEASVAVR